MKAGVRAVGVAESFADDRSTLAAAVVRADRVVDGLAFGSCTVGGTDASDRIVDVVAALEREDVQYVLVAGIAPAWYNLVDLGAVHEAVDRPVLAVTFEDAADPLDVVLDETFSGEALETRLEIYRRLPPRSRLVVNGEEVFVRPVGIDDAAARDVVRRFTPEGGRPEPLRVARLAARAADRWTREPAG